MSTTRFYRFTFTNYYNPERPNRTLRKFINYFNAKAKFWVIGKEICPETGRPHFQGYVEFNNAHTVVGLKRWERTEELVHSHWEIAIEDRKHNFDYCTKPQTKEDPDDWWAIEDYEGLLTITQGKRTDIDAVKGIIKNGGGMKEIIEVARNYQCLKMGELILKYTNREMDRDLTVMFFWGEAGSGKTREALTIARKDYPDSWWMSSGNSKWFDGYSDQKLAILDDLRSNTFSEDMLLRLLDRYPMRVEIKGATVPWVPLCIIITSNHSPEDLWAGSQNLRAILRRIKTIREFK